MSIFYKLAGANHEPDNHLHKNISGFVLLLISILLMKFDTVSAQDDTYIPPSPTSVSVIKAEATDVNLYGGKANINIPIYTVAAGSLSTNISLKYVDGSGIKVQEIPGEAGLGWALMAGGVISRTIRGSDDTNGYFSNPGSGYLQNTPGSPEFQKAFSNFSDGDLEPDIYNSTIGGRIIFDKGKQPHFMNEQGFKIIQSGIFSADHTWIIADSYGTEYYFGETMDALERYAQTTSGGTQSLTSRVSAWHLNRIVSKDGASIQFDYEKSGKLSQFKYYSFTRSRSGGSSTWTNHTNSLPAPSEEVHLSKITTKNATIEFLYKDREDFIDSKALSEIKVLDSQGVLLTRYAFETDYFKSADATPTLRLKMKSIKRYNGAGNSMQLVASFDYNEQDNLPARNSEKFDYWGYYNNNTTGKYFLSEGANRAADINKCQVNILTGIRWPTGGVTNYFYELNSYQRNGIEYSGGGIRLSSICEKNTDNTSLITRYDYTDATLPKKSSGLSHTLFDITKGYTSIFRVKVDNEVSNDDDVYLSENALPLTKAIDLDGIAVGYSRVTVIFPDESSEVYSFQDYFYFPDETKHYSYTKFTFATPVRVENFIPINDQDQYNGFNSVTSNAGQRGLINTKEIHNNNHVLIKSIHYKYDVYSGPAIPGAEIHSPYTYIGAGGWSDNFKEFNIASLYYERVMAARLTEVKEDDYFLSGNSTTHSVTTLNDYKPVPYPTLLAKQTQKQANGRILTVSYNYPSDMISLGRDPNGIYEGMVAKNITAPIVERISTINNQQISLIRTNYGTFNNGGFLPKNIEEQTGNKPIEVTQLFNSYDINGNLLEQQKNAGFNQVYLWGYNGQYPVAKITGSDYNTVKGFINQSVLDNAGTTDAAMREELNKIRTGLAGKTALITSYTYAPQVGMTSNTDAKGATTYYEYDGFQRLINVKNQYGNIVKNNSYNYAGQSNAPATTTYYNTELRDTYFRNNCATNYTGAAISYVVPQGKYSSSLSLEDAMQKAQNDLNANGQAYANSNGICTVADVAQWSISYGINDPSGHVVRISVTKTAADINLNNTVHYRIKMISGSDLTGFFDMPAGVLTYSKDETFSQQVTGNVVSIAIDYVL